MALSPNMNVMIKAVEKAGRSLVRDFGEVEQLQVSKKGPNDFVSAADIRSEEILHAELSRARPDFSFLMEEKGEEIRKDKTTRWIIDPLDGTTNFLHGIPHWCISLALEENGEVTAAVIHDPVKDETFRAERGQGAFIRNKRLRVSGRNNFEQCMIYAGGPRASEESKKLFIAEYQQIQNAGIAIRRMGAAALDLAYVAAGRCEGFWERGLFPWDIAAGSLIMKESGGRISELSGSSKNPIYTGNVLATNSALHDDISKLLKNPEHGKDAA
jgi:myo-inositol-1(or 4)-monophosphatase